MRKSQVIFSTVFVKMPWMWVAIDSVSSRGYLDAPAILPTSRLGARVWLLFKLTNQKRTRRNLRGIN